MPTSLEIYDFFTSIDTSKIKNFVDRFGVDTKYELVDHLLINKRWSDWRSFFDHDGLSSIDLKN